MIHLQVRQHCRHRERVTTLWICFFTKRKTLYLKTVNNKEQHVRLLLETVNKKKQNVLDISFEKAPHLAAIRFFTLNNVQL